MTRVNPASFHNWQEGEVVHSTEYKQEREILYTAINGSDDQIKDRYTKAETDAKLVNIAGGAAYSFRKEALLPATATDGDVIFLTADYTLNGVVHLGNRPYQYIAGKWYDFLVRAIVPTGDSATLAAGTQIVTAPEDALAQLSFRGRTLINLVGRAGNCESLAPLTTFGATIALDTANVVYGSNSIKVTTSVTNQGNMFMPAVTLKAGRFYIGLAEIKNGNDAFGGRLAFGSTTGTYTNDTTKFVLKYIKINPSVDVTDKLRNDNGGTINQYAYYDGFRLFEITQAEYSALDTMTADQIAAKYPYVDDMKHINGVYAINPGENLFPPIVELDRVDSPGWAIVDTYKAIGNTTSAGQLLGSDSIKAVAGQQYTLSFGAETTTNFSVINRYVDAAGNNIYDSGWLPYTGTPIVYPAAPAGTVRHSFAIGFLVGAMVVNKPMLNVGTIAKPFVPQNKTYTFLPDVQAKSNADGTVVDQVYIQNGQARAVRQFKEITLDGSLDWVFSTDFSGYKTVRATRPSNILVNAATPTDKFIKFDGKINKVDHSTYPPIADSIYIDGTYMYLGIPDIDSGWGESYSPTAGEVQAYFWGWKMYNSSATSDGTGEYNGSGTKAWCRAGDRAGNATTLPVTSNYGGNTQPHRLMYQLAQSVNEAVVSEGTLEMFAGPNQIEVGTGIVLREGVAPAYSTLYDNYFINIRDGADAQIPVGAQLKQRTASIFNVYRNTQPDRTYIKPGNTYGNAGAQWHSSKFDKTASFTVSYFALDTYALGIAPQASTLQFAKDAGSILSALVDEAADLRAEVDALRNTKANKQQSGWIAPTLLNGWVNGPGLATAGYLKDEFGFIHLKGYLTSGVSTPNTTLFTLPVGYRPSETMRLTSHGANGGTTVIVNYQIDTSGAFKIIAGATDLVLSVPPFRAV